MFSPCFDLVETKTHPFNHLPLPSNPYMTPDTSVCREEWQRLVNEIKAAYAAAEKDAAFPQASDMRRLQIWAEKELAAVNAYCDWVDVCQKFSDTDYLAAIYNRNAFHPFYRVAHWRSLVSKVSSP